MIYTDLPFGIVLFAVIMKEKIVFSGLIQFFALISPIPFIKSLWIRKYFLCLCSLRVQHWLGCGVCPLAVCSMLETAHKQVILLKESKKAFWRRCHLRPEEWTWLFQGKKGTRRIPRRSNNMNKDTETGNGMGEMHEGDTNQFCIIREWRPVDNRWDIGCRSWWGLEGVNLFVLFSINGKILSRFWLGWW